MPTATVRLLAAALASALLPGCYVVPIAPDAALVVPAAPLPAVPAPAATVLPARPYPANESAASGGVVHGAVVDPGEDLQQRPRPCSPQPGGKGRARAPLMVARLANTLGIRGGERRDGHAGATLRACGHGVNRP